jgi:hypothetical protein
MVKGGPEEESGSTAAEDKNARVPADHAENLRSPKTEVKVEKSGDER